MENEKKETEAKVEEKKPIPSALEEAKELAKRIEEANKKTEELLQRQEQIAANNILGGRTYAGQAEPPVVDHETEVKERVNKLLEKTGLKI